MKILKTISCAGLLLASVAGRAGDNTGIDLYESGMYNVSKIYFLKQLNTAATPEAKAEACFYLGENYLQLNQPDSAAYYYRQGVELLPSYPFNQIGIQKLALKNMTGKEALKKAEAAFKEIIKTDKKNIRLPLAVARAYVYAGNTAKAADFIKDAKKVDGKSGLPYIIEGDILWAQEKYGDAASKYDMAIYFSRELVGAYMKNAYLYRSINRDATFEKLKKVGEIAPGFSGHYQLLGEIYKDIPGQSALAAENYGKFIEAGYYDSEHLLTYAGILYFDKQYEKMLPIVKSVVRQNLDNLVAKRLLAYGLSKTEPGEESIRAIKDFVETTSEERLIMQDYLCYAEQLEANKHYAAAAENYKKVIQKDESKKALLHNIADLYQRDQQPDSAIRYYNLYMDFTGQPDPAIYFQIGRNYYTMAMADSVNAKALYLQADSLFAMLTEIAPTSYLGFFWRARTNSALDPETTEGLAQPYYEKVIELVIDQPDRYKMQLIEAYKYFGYFHYLKADAITTQNKGNAKPAREEYLKVKEYFSKVLELDPNDATALKVMEDIKIE
ncbi:MAG: tetratricopeptide repeat protein [Prevotellaceae bacterium]|jgi:tetratricopeptide (TPR) repeat protein|nr:tetratricopeptide repeat protein [Prevotellaceae bacterium]